MDRNLKDAKANIGEAKEEIKEMLNDHFDTLKSNVSSHLDEATDATKGAIADMANSVKKAAESVPA